MTLVKREHKLGDPYSQWGRFFDRPLLSSDFWPGIMSYTNPMAIGRGFPVDVYGNDDSYFLVAELPGVKKENIDLKLENAVLTISAKRKVDEGENSSDYSMDRSITVGDDVDSDGVSAKLANGVLTITLPKAEERKPKSITIG